MNLPPPKPTGKPYKCLACQVGWTNYGSELDCWSCRRPGVPGSLRLRDLIFTTHAFE